MKGVYGENLISVALKTPNGFRGMSYRKLSPKYDWWQDRYEHSYEWFKEQFQKTVLDELDVHDVVKKLGEDAILCCWEKDDTFCHRHIIADWIREAGYIIEEYSD